MRTSDSKIGVTPLIHHDIKVWDALPICEYLAETWLEGRGWPQHQKKREVRYAKAS